MNKDPQVSKLSKEETGRLTGGFTIHDVEVSNHFFYNQRKLLRRWLGRYQH